MECTKCVKAQVHEFSRSGVLRLPTGGAVATFDAAVHTRPVADQVTDLGIRPERGPDVLAQEAGRDTSR